MIRHSFTRGAVLGLAGLGLTALLSACAPGQFASTQEEPAGGIGGTGIIGTLTGFGSLLVNGVTVETDDRTPFVSPIGGRGLADLAIGQVVEIEAERIDGRVVARRVGEIVALAGPLTTVDPDGPGLTLLGARVDTTSAILPETLEPGTEVMVSGLWRGDLLIASRIDPVSLGGIAFASGVISRPGGGVLHIGGVPIIGVGPGIGSLGQFATIAGRPAEGGMTAVRLAFGRPVLGEGAYRQLSVEGFLVKDAAAGHYELSGLGRPLDETARLDPVSGGRAVLLGRLGQRFSVEHGAPLPEDPAARAEALDALGDGLAPTGNILDLR